MIRWKTWSDKLLTPVVKIRETVKLLQAGRESCN